MKCKHEKLIAYQVIKNIDNQLVALYECRDCGRIFKEVVKNLNDKR